MSGSHNVFRGKRGRRQRKEVEPRELAVLASGDDQDRLLDFL